MKIWFNKVDESRRQSVDFLANEVRIGRDPSNDVVLKSPLVSRRHAVVRRVDGQLELENVGVNSCLVGEKEVLGGECATFAPTVKLGASLTPVMAMVTDTGALDSPPSSTARYWKESKPK